MVGLGIPTKSILGHLVIDLEVYVSHVSGVSHIIVVIDYFFYKIHRFKGFQCTPTMVGLGIPLKSFIRNYRQCRLDV